MADDAGETEAEKAETKDEAKENDIIESDTDEDVDDSKLFVGGNTAMEAVVSTALLFAGGVMPR